MMFRDDEKQSEVRDDTVSSSGGQTTLSSEQKLDDALLCASMSPRSSNTASQWSSSSLGSVSARDSVLSRVTREPRWLITGSDQSTSPLITPRSLEASVPRSRRRQRRIESAYVRIRRSSSGRVTATISEQSSTGSQRSSVSTSGATYSSGSSEVSSGTPDHSTSAPKSYRVGTLDLVLGDSLKRLVDSTEVYRRCFLDHRSDDDVSSDSTSLEAASELRRRLSDDGYVFIRGVIPKRLVSQALSTVAKGFGDYFDCMAPEPGNLSSSSESGSRSRIPDSSAVLPLSSTVDGCSRVPPLEISSSEEALTAPVMRMRDKNRDRIHVLTGFTPITHTEQVLNCVQSSELIRLVAMLLNTKSVATLDTKWLRIVGFEQNTAQHSDYYRFSHYYDCSEDFELYTCWTPLMSVPLKKGPLAVCVGSHALDFDAATKSDGEEVGSQEEDSEHREQDDRDDHDADDDRDGEDSPTDTGELPEGFAEFAATIGQWRSHDFEAGDIVVFNSKLVHASLKNETDCYRVSIDTRWVSDGTLSEEMPLRKFNAAAAATVADSAACRGDSTA